MSHITYLGQNNHVLHRHSHRSLWPQDCVLKHWLDWLPNGCYTLISGLCLVLERDVFCTWYLWPWTPDHPWGRPYRPHWMGKGVQPWNCHPWQLIIEYWYLAEDKQDKIEQADHCLDLGHHLQSHATCKAYIASTVWQFSSIHGNGPGWWLLYETRLLNIGMAY